MNMKKEEPKFVLFCESCKDGIRLFDSNYIAGKGRVCIMCFNILKREDDSIVKQSKFNGKVNT